MTRHEIPAATRDERYADGAPNTGFPVRSGVHRDPHRGHDLADLFGGYVPTARDQWYVIAALVFFLVLIGFFALGGAGLVTR